MVWAYFSGVLAALTPCTIALIPLFMYRFGVWGGDDKRLLKKELLYVTIGFLLGLAGVAVFFQWLSGSNLYNLIRLILGTSLTIVGILQLAGKFQIYMVRSIMHPFVLGVIFPLAISLSPCVIPIFSTLLVVSSDGLVWLQFLLFGLGLLSPLLLVGILGNKLLETMRKATPIFTAVDRYSGLLIIASGIFLNFQVFDIQHMDLIIAGTFLVLIMLLGAYFLFVKKRRLTVGTGLLFVSLLIIVGIFLSNCYNDVTVNATRDASGNVDVYPSCSMSEEGEHRCRHCTKCAAWFSIAGVVGGAGYLLAEQPFRIRFA